MPSVSIVVPCYNGGRFIDQLEACLAAQTFRDFEVVVVDDGSSDAASRDRLDRLVAPFRVLHQDNQGPGAARNTGIRAARGEIVVTLDCDDTIDPTFLEETVGALRGAPPEIGFVFCQDRLIGAGSGEEHYRYNPFELLFVNRMTSCLVMWRRVWEAVGGYDESMRAGYEDWEFNIRLARAGIKGLEIPKVLSSYHVSDGGMLLSTSTQHHARLWHYIRGKHREIYRLPALLRLWWRHREPEVAVSLPVALGLLTLANLLPERWFTALIRYVRRRRIGDGLKAEAAATA